MSIASYPISLVPVETWIVAIISSACIGSTSLVPWIFNMTFFEHHKSQRGLQTRNSRMDYLLSFSVGAILGDIFFHLIPESLESHIFELNDPIILAQKKVGLAIIAGIFTFIIVEMILDKWSVKENSIITTKISNESTDHHDLYHPKDCVKESINSIKLLDLNNNVIQDCFKYSQQIDEIRLLKRTKKDIAQEKKSKYMDNTRMIGELKESLIQTQEVSDESLPKSSPSRLKIKSSNVQTIDPAGYLSLIANGIDNFTHGLAIGASFLVGPKVGLLTTFIIFIHEIPHEICDYAILVNSGFSRWHAVKAQSSVSLFCMMGTIVALYFKSIDTLTAKTVWILPFTAGGFIHIALVNLLPDILSRRTNFRDTAEQIGCISLGIAFMGSVALS